MFARSLDFSFVWLLCCSLGVGVIGVGVGRGWVSCTNFGFWCSVRDVVMAWFVWIAWALMAVVDRES